MLNYLGTQDVSAPSEFGERVAEDHARIVNAFGPKSAPYIPSEYPKAVFKEVNGVPAKFVVHSEAEETALLAEPHAE